MFVAGHANEHIRLDFYHVRRYDAIKTLNTHTIYNLLFWHESPLAW
jgi:hypothetical protein